jgi:GT2 family glycosyltransferase/glycosyltransferase involved in cell wall biosynthesis
VRENRFFSRTIDLQKYTAAHAVVGADLKADPTLDAYVHLLTVGTSLGLAAGEQAVVESHLGEDRSKTQFRAEARLVALTHARHGIDFTVTGNPVVSVIMVVHNRFALTVAALASLRDNIHEPVELILVDSGSTDETTRIETVIKGSKLVRLDTNEGFVRACNAGLNLVTAETVLLLNNDIRLSPRAVPAALQKLHSCSDIGAVGGKIVRTHGVLQEAGGLIWRDGSTSGYLRGHDPLEPAANYARDVDYCSAVFLLTPTALLKALGGFDPDYAPSYYEDTDLCVRMQELGFRVVYDPAVVVHHLEYGSLDAADEAAVAMERGRKTFLRKHADWLLPQPERGDVATAIRRRSSGVGRILFIDDTVPVRAMGSGFVRANDIVGEMTALGYAVTVFPVNPCGLPMASIYPDFPDNVEILHGHSIDTLDSFLEQAQGHFNVIWISRTHNLRLVKDAIKHLRDPEGKPVRVIVDTEAVASLRNRTKARVKPQAPASEPMSLGTEFRHVAPDAHVICVSEAERVVLQAVGLTKVSILGHFRTLDLTPKSFEDRKDLLILGAIHEADSPNHDALYWFVENVLPLVTEALGPEVAVSVAGYQGSAVDLTDLADNPQVRLLGCVPNTWSLYDDHRIFIAPTRFAAGIPYKIHEAASFGLPIVTTGLIAGQTGWGHGTELLAADERNPQAFAQQVIALYRTPALWQSLRLYAGRRLMRDHNQNDYRRALGSILGNAQSAETTDASPDEFLSPSYPGGMRLPSVRIA